MMSTALILAPMAVIAAAAVTGLCVRRAREGGQRAAEIADLHALYAAESTEEPTP